MFHFSQLDKSAPLAYIIIAAVKCPSLDSSKPDNIKIVMRKVL